MGKRALTAKEMVDIPILKRKWLLSNRALAIRFGVHESTIIRVLAKQKKKEGKKKGG